MNRPAIIEQAKVQRIMELLPQLGLRYNLMRDLLVRAIEGEDVNESQLLLAQSDLQSVLSVMTGSELFGKRDD